MSVWWGWFRMADKLLSVKEAETQFMSYCIPAFFAEEVDEFRSRVATLIFAVRREQDKITTKRERERAVKIILGQMPPSFRLLNDENKELVVAGWKKKILEEK